MRFLKRTAEIFIVQLIAFVICTSCIRNKDLRNFTLYNETKKTDLNKLKINGVYYTLKKKENYRFRNNDYVTGFVLYENGTYLNLNSTEIKVDKKTAINSLVEHFENYKKIYSKDLDNW